MTFFFEVTLDVFKLRRAAGNHFRPFRIQQKRELYGSGRQRQEIRTPDGSLDELEQNFVQSLPKASVQVAQPVGLSARLCEGRTCCCRPCCRIPDFIADGTAEASVWKIPIRVVYATIGIFTIVQIERNVK